MSWWRICPDVLHFRRTGTDCLESAERVVDEMSTIQIWSEEGERDRDATRHEKYTLFRNSIGLAVLQELLVYVSERENGSMVEGTIMSVARLDAWNATEVSCLVERETCGGHGQQQYTDTYGRMMEVAIKQLIGSVRELVVHWA